MGNWSHAPRESPIAVNRDTSTHNYLVRYSGDDLSQNPSHPEQVKDYLWYQLPSIYDEMYLVDIDIEQLSHENPVTFAATARYTGRPIGNIEWEFSVAGESVHINNSLETVATHKAHFSGDPVNYNQLINVKSDGDVEGVDILAPTHKFSITYTNLFTTFNQEYITAVQDLVGTVNGVPFFSYAIGEVLFTGFDGKLATPTTRGEHNTSTLRFQFERSKNTTIRLKGFSTFEKRGWDYMWMATSFKREASPGTSETMSGVGKQVKAIYIERVYDYTNFKIMRLEN